MNEFLSGAAVVMSYIAIMAGSILFMRKAIKIPDELFRKILHFILLGAYIPLVFSYETWWMATLLAVCMMALFYPILAAAEKIPAFDAFLNQRRKGEIKNSMILALSMMVLSIFVCWGIFRDRYLVLSCVYAWGVGDAFAALVGKKYGKHKVRLRFADPHKSIEGSLAMLITSAIAVFIVLSLRGGIDFVGCAVIALAGATVSMVVELCTKNGYDTFTCPFAAMIVILPLIRLMGG